MSDNKKQQHQRITARKLFPRKQRAPLAVQDKASLWLDLYVDFAVALTHSDEPLSEYIMRPDGWHQSRVEPIVTMAATLADFSLDAFEKRWPTAEVPSRE